MRNAVVGLGVVFAMACTKSPPDDVFGSGEDATSDMGESSETSIAPPPGSTGPGESVGSDGEADGGLKLDLGLQPDLAPDCVEPEDCECEVVPHEPCDVGDDPGMAMGLGCAGEHAVTISTRAPQPGAIGTLDDFGDTGAFAPREGSRFAVLGTGLVADLQLPAGAQRLQQGDRHRLHRRRAISRPGGPDRRPGHRAAPTTRRWSAPATAPTRSRPSTTRGSITSTTRSCASRAACPTAQRRSSSTSRTSASSTRCSTSGSSTTCSSPGSTASGGPGNVSFDADGNAISLNAGFLDYRDVPGGTDNDPLCTNGCAAPELHGTCMEGHAGTRWLHTKAPAEEGGDFTLVFAIFDLSDPNLDSYVFLDNFRFGCEDGPPVTEPEG